MTNLGNRIRILRALNGLSQVALGNLAEIDTHRIAIIAYEQNRYRPIRNNLVSIAKALSVSAGYLDYGQWDKDTSLVWRPLLHKQGGFDKKTVDTISLLLPDFVLETGFDLFAKIDFDDGVAVLFGYKKVITCVALIEHEISHLFPGEQISARSNKFLSCFQESIRIVAPAHGYEVHPKLSAIIEFEAVTAGDKNASDDRLVMAAQDIAALKRQQDQGVSVNFSNAIVALCQALENTEYSK